MATPPWGEAKRRAAEDDRARSRDKGHGRVEVRRIVTTTRLTGSLDWPGVKRVCLLERVRRIQGKQTTEAVCAITSLGPERASAARLPEIARGHRELENRLHWARDMSLGEDAGRVRSGAAPQVLSGLRNTVLYVLRATGLARIAEALRHLAARPDEAVQRVMQPLAPEL